LFATLWNGASFFPCFTTRYGKTKTTFFRCAFFFVEAGLRNAPLFIFFSVYPSHLFTARSRQSSCDPFFFLYIGVKIPNFFKFPRSLCPSGGECYFPLRLFPGSRSSVYHPFFYRIFFCCWFFFEEEDLSGHPSFFALVPRSMTRHEI